MDSLIMEKLQYTGLNYKEVQEFTDFKVLAPYEGMGFSMLSILNDDGLLTVNEGDYICKDENGHMTIE